MINFDDKIYDIVQSNPGILEFLIANGFENLANEKMLEMMGKQITLTTALNAKGINRDLFEDNLNQFLQSKEEFSTDKSKIFENYDKNNDVAVKGVLPCPIRVPLTDTIDEFIKSEKRAFDIYCDLEPASNGIDSIRADLNSEDENKYPDIITSAGFEFFFGERVKSLIDKGIYSSEDYEINKEFITRDVDLKDPKNNYHIMGIVPAIFIVNTALLDGRKLPTSWEDLLSEEFAGKVSIPFMDLDLFNAIVLTVYAKFGMEGIKKLRRSYHQNLHPSQMVKANKNEAIVSISPYFFTTMIQDKSLKAVWPSDGAIISPIFMISKSKRENVRAVTEFLNSKAIGEIFSFNGNFPSTNKDVDNHLSDDKTYMWVGWDFIYNNDIENLIAKFTDLFTK
ncbi:PF08984 domain protein [Peptoanaerobacter stomatis]|uniref:PF08984 domain protein n=1 Tax=Peptoanaerobacter stomatis TaxID=796937 RepID=J4W0X6_9FIRM|nr:ABC transporter substrate-binding protein [Peptoanaerobacter stomatis]EJU19951.1 PF08984 domain protein [Peptoanaerobacter stomatis]NWO26074.1 ABC transporter substrate-binding protein [Peptostreptococcaceae bacterium oral taxon 081]